MKSLFFSVLALAALASCNKEEGTSKDNSPKTVRISLDYGALTRSIGVPQTAGAPTLSNVQVEFFASTNGTGAALKSEALTDAQMATLNGGGSGNKTVVLAAPDGANSLRLVANNGVTTTISKSIVDFQGKDVKKAIPYEGVGQILVSGTNADGKDVYAANVALKVSVARVEVSGVIKPASSKWTVEVVGVYANNFLATQDESSLFTLLGAGGEVTNTPLIGMFDLKTANTTTWGNVFMEGPSLCAGYQYFTGTYGLVLQVKEKFDSSPEEISFIKINSFSRADGDKSQITNLDAGKIYKLDLTTSGIGDKYKDDGSKPSDPDLDPDKTVSVIVSVMEWTVQNVIPNL